MTKTEATALLGGSISTAADAIGITVQAYFQWPEELSDKLRDRVQAALWRKSHGVADRASVAAEQGG